MGLFTDLEKFLTPAAKSGPPSPKAAWLAGYQQASFRGVEFFIETAENTGGRRIASHAFPNRDDIVHEDLGRAERGMRISAYVVADNYYQLRENLIAALEAEGPGRFVHPYRGVFQAVVKNFTQRESTREGRMARFEIDFAEQKVEELTQGTANKKQDTKSKKKSFIDSLNEEFIAAYNIAQMAVSGVQDATQAIDNALTVLENAKKVVSSVADFKRELSNLRGKLIQATLDATDLANTLSDLVNFGTDGTTVISPGQQLREMNDIFSAMQANPSQTPDDIYNQPDYAAKQIQTLVAQAAIAGAVGLTADIEYESAEQALEVRDGVFELLDGVLEDPNTADTVFAAARSAKAAVVEDLGDDILDLAKLVDYKPVDNTNTLVLSNTIYGDVAHEQEIIDRNQLLHPMFISAGVPVKVVADA